MTWPEDQIWRIAAAMRKAVNQELYGGAAPNDSTALSEVMPGTIVGLGEHAACFSIGGAPAIEIAVVLVPTAHEHFASVADTRRALGQTVEEQ